VRLRQVVCPLHVTDRCVSCHVGMAPGERGGDRSGLAPHPTWCTIPASSAARSATAGRGGRPRRPTRTATSISGRADDPAASTPTPAAAPATRTSACRTSRGWRGRAAARALRLPGLPPHRRPRRHAAPGRRRRHGRSRPVARRRRRLRPRTGTSKHLQGTHGDRRSLEDSFGPVPSTTARRSRSFLASRVGAPRLVEAKALFHSLGCRGCHKVGGVGGDDGPDLTRAGEQGSPGHRLQPRPGEHTIANWHAEHFRRRRGRARFADAGLRAHREQIELLTLVHAVVAAQRRARGVLAQGPHPAERFGEREFATDGATLYGTFCAACHGRRARACAIRACRRSRRSAIRISWPSPRIEFLPRPSATAGPGAGCPPGASGRRAAAGRDRPRRRALRARSAGVPEPRRNVPSGAGSRPTRRRASALRRRTAPAATARGRGEGAEGPALSNPVLLAAATTRTCRNHRRGRRGTSMPGFRSGSPTIRRCRRRADRGDRGLHSHLGEGQMNRHEDQRREFLRRPGRRLRRLLWLRRPGLGAGRGRQPAGPYPESRLGARLPRPVEVRLDVHLPVRAQRHAQLPAERLRALGRHHAHRPDDALRRGDRPRRQPRHAPLGSARLPEGLALTRRFYGDRRVNQQCMVRAGFKRWYEAGSRAARTAAAAEYFQRARDEWVRVPHDEAAGDRRRGAEEHRRDLHGRGGPARLGRRATTKRPSRRRRAPARRC
jgi:hypothetical protein